MAHRQARNAAYRQPLLHLRHQPPVARWSLRPSLRGQPPAEARREEPQVAGLRGDPGVPPLWAHTPTPRGPQHGSLAGPVAVAGTAQALLRLRLRSFSKALSL